MLEFIVPVIIACLGSGAVAAFVTSVFTRKKVQAEADKLTADGKKVSAEAAQITVDSALKVVGDLRVEIIRLTARVEILEKENQDLRFQLEAVRRGY